MEGALLFRAVLHFTTGWRRTEESGLLVKINHTLLQFIHPILNNKIPVKIIFPFSMEYIRFLDVGKV